MAPSPMGIFSRSFETMFATQPTMRARLRVGRKQLDRCLCGSFATTRTATDEGVYEAVLASVRAVKTEFEAAFGTDRPEGWRVEFARAGESFQPTRPVRGAAPPPPPLNRTAQVSTHAPRTGRGPWQKYRAQDKVRVSTHAPRTGRGQGGS